LKKVAIIICNYNKEKEVLACIRCVLEQKFTDYALYVVDNASTDGSVQAIREMYPTQVHLIVNSENLGGSGGFNAGLKKAFEEGYPYLMCVDNDAMLDADAVGKLVAFLDAHPEVGMAASKVYHLDAPEYIQQYGQKIDFESFCTEVPDLNRPEDGTQPDYRYVDAVAACALMVRRTTVEKIGLMPEENFLYWDDTEWCYRCSLAGMKVASVGTSKVYHEMGARKEDINTFPTYYSWRNWIRFFAKYTPDDRLEKLSRDVLGSVFYEVYGGIHRGEYNRMRTVMMAYDDALCGVAGKAGPNRIFAVDHNEEPFRRMFASCTRFYIEENHYPALASWLRELPGQLGIEGISWADAPAPGVKTISLCESIFRIDDMSLTKIYIDLDNCIFRDEDDALDVINFNYSKRSFIISQKPIFLEKLRRRSREERFD
jgi:GT2 family glycosyltransferase